MKRGNPPKRRKRLPRSSQRIRSRKADPSKRRFAKRRCQPYLDWLKEQRCQVTSQRTGEWHWPIIHVYGFMVTVDPAHIKARGAGGDDLYNALSLAHHLHEEQHRIGAKTFWAKYKADPVAIAKRQTEEFLGLHPQYRTEAVF